MAHRRSAPTRSPVPFPPLALAVILGLTLGACATNPVTGRREVSLMSEAQEIQLGQQADGEVRREMGIYDDPELTGYVEGIGLRLAHASERPNLPWHFAIVDSPAVNAFALPGGYIYLTRGIMPYLRNEAELAGVLGHEIGHVTARHAAQAYTRSTGAQIGLVLSEIFIPQTRPLANVAQSGVGLLFLKYGRDDELEADGLGAKYEARTGWDPASVPAFLTTLGRIDEATDRKGVPNWLSTHPQPADRVQKIQATVAELEAQGGDRKWTAEREGYLRRLDGLMFGDNPREGVVRGREFLHPDLRFALRFPDGWDVNNGKTQVEAKAPNADAYVMLQLDDRPQGRDIDDVATASMTRAGFREIQGGSTDINGLTAHVGTYQGTIQGLGAVVTRVAHILNGGRVFVVAGLAPSKIFESAERDFSETIRSFRLLNASEAADVRPNRIDLYVAREGDTWQSIAERAGKGIVKPATLAIMNGQPVNEQPRAGERLKIVVAG
jgi:predicted Zn-dependent protease